jgi:DNA mismatch endonuclease, patch repair protein
VADTLSKEERSARMAKVRGTGNRSTEGRVEAALKEQGITGWTKHPQDVPGRPDFYFPDQRVALFVDGCFWHACPRCGRIPKSRVEFWRAKIDANRRRDNRTRRRLRRQGYHVVRVWEHELRSLRWIGRLRGYLRRLDSRAAGSSVIATSKGPTGV